MQYPYHLARVCSLAAIVLVLVVLSTTVSAQSLDPMTGEEIPLAGATLGIPADASAPDSQRGDESLTLISRLADGETRGLALVGDILYRSNGGYMEAMDVSNPESPEVLGRFLVDDALVMSVAVEGDHAYVPAQRPNVFGNRGSLQIVDVSDPTNPTGVGAITGRSFYDATVVGTTLYAAALGGGLRIYDVSTPSEPDELGFVTISGGSVLAVEVVGTLAYVAAGGAGLHVIDISDPTEPEIVGSFSVDLYPDINEFATDITVAGDRAYVTAQPLGLIVVNVEDPTDPVEAGHYVIEEPSSTQTRTVTLDGTTAYVGKDDGMISLDVSDPSNITRLGTLDFGAPGSGQSIFLTDDTAWVGNRYHGVRVVDISDPATMSQETLIQNGGFSFKVKVVGDLVYVVDLIGELRIVDISDRNDPHLLGRIGGFSNAYRVDVVGDIAYLTRQASSVDGNGSVVRIDVSDPTNPTMIDETHQPTGVNGVQIVGDIAFTASGTSGTGQGSLVALDAQDMETVGTVDANNTAFDVRVAGDHAFVATFGSGLSVFDVAEPANMTLLSSGQVGATSHTLTIDGSTLYMADNSFADARGLTVVDISNPTDPQELGSGNVMAGASSVDVAYHAGMAYAAVDMVGIFQFDVSDPSNVTEMYNLTTSNRATGVDVRDELVILVDTGTGVWIFEAPGAISSEEGATAETLVFESSYPNPFSGQTTLSYRLPEMHHVTVTVHDVLGRQVRTLVDGPQNAGAHEVVFSGSGLASGVYFVRVTTGSETVVRQVTLVQ